MGLIPVLACLTALCFDAIRGVLACAGAALTSVPASAFARKIGGVTPVLGGDDIKGRFYRASVFIMVLNSDRYTLRHRTDPPAEFKILFS